MADEQTVKFAIAFIGITALMVLVFFWRGRGL
jgi:hypothetical protein